MIRAAQEAETELLATDGVNSESEARVTPLEAVAAVALCGGVAALITIAALMITLVTYEALHFRQRRAELRGAGA